MYNFVHPSSHTWSYSWMTLEPHRVLCSTVNSRQGRADQSHRTERWPAQSHRTDRWPAQSHRTERGSAQSHRTERWPAQSHRTDRWPARSAQIHRIESWPAESHQLLSSYWSSHLYSDQLEMIEDKEHEVDQQRYQLGIHISCQKTDRERASGDTKQENGLQSSAGCSVNYQ